MLDDRTTPTRENAPSPLTRRRLLLGGAAALATACTGGGRGPRPTTASAPAMIAARGEVFDVCIVGSGFAGATLAAELATAGVRTILLDAGPRLGDNPTDLDGAAERLPLPTGGEIDYPVRDSRTIGVGGTSHKWTGVLSRLLPTDLDRWPLRYQTLYPYYCRAETRLDAYGGAPRPGEPPRRCRYPHEEPYEPPKLDDDMAFFPLAFSRRDDGGPARIVRSELPRFEAAGGLLLADTSAIRLLAPSGHQVESIETVGPGAPDQIRARTFVVAAGTFESARLLAASTAPGHTDGLGNAGGRLGGGLMVHLNLRAEVLGNHDQPLGIHRSYQPDDELRRRGLGGCLIQLHARPDSLALNAQIAVEPDPANGVVLTGDAAGEAAPARLDYHYTERDHRTLEQATLLRDRLLVELDVDPASVQTDRSWRYHPAGTCPMATAPTRGVVDRDGRVFGTGNLFVCGAATYPAAGVANPTLTVVALALRLADHLLATRFPSRRRWRNR